MNSWDALVDSIIFRIKDQAHDYKAEKLRLEHQISGIKTLIDQDKVILENLLGRIEEVRADILEANKVNKEREVKVEKLRWERKDIESEAAKMRMEIVATQKQFESSISQKIDEARISEEIAAKEINKEEQELKMFRTENIKLRQELDKKNLELQSSKVLLYSINCKERARIQETGKHSNAIVDTFQYCFDPVGVDMIL